MDASLASRTLLFDISEKKWSQPLLQGCGIEESKLPESVPCGQEIGKVSAEIAQRFGFSFGCGIVSGGHDQLCCSLGAGVLKSGELMDSLGTTESMVCVNDRLVLTEDMAKNSIPCSVYPVNGLYAYMTFLTGCGSLLRWLKENLFCSNDENFYYYFDDNVEKSYNGPSEVTILPYFSGAGTPRLDFRARGSITGLTLDTNRRQIYQAMMEATCLEEKWNLDNMERCGVPAEELRCIGGGSRSRIWLQIKADVTGHRVLSLRIGEAGCLGAAILAGLGHGVFRTAEEAVAQYVKVREEFRPDPEKHEKYQEKMECYLRLYSSGNL
jgi:xylulokinase